MLRKIIFYTLFATSIFGCANKQSKSSSENTTEVVDSAKVTVSHAEGFNINYCDSEGVCLVEIRDPQKQNSETYKFALVEADNKRHNVPEGYVCIQRPVKSVICMTSLQLSNFIKLGETQAVVGVTSTRHLFNEDIRRQIDKGLTARIGIEGNFDSEFVIGINPDLILISPFKRGGYESLKDTSIPLVPHLGYKEKTPLAQAEWIKLIGLLLGKTEKANATFESIEKRYNELCAKVSDVESRPMVLSGETRGGAWYAPGGKSFLAQMFRDAGATYFLHDDTDTGGKNLDFESVYSRAADAQYWRIMNSYKGDFSYEALSDEDKRYEDFRAYKERGVIYCNMSQTPYYEKMPTEPEVILADFIHIFHPQILPNHTPTYYYLLK